LREKRLVFRAVEQARQNDAKAKVAPPQKPFLRRARKP
jgi:hypothetical protein